MTRDIMDLDKFTKEITALQKQSGDYSANTAIKADRSLKSLNRD